jgi:adenylylsulfate kinase-like enzyme
LHINVLELDALMKKLPQRLRQTKEDSEKRISVTTAMFSVMTSVGSVSYTSAVSPELQ